MPRGVWLLAALSCALTSRAEDNCKLGAPCYSEAGIVNAASFEAGALSPNALISIFGNNLSFVTQALASEDIAGGVLPVELPGTGVRVMLNGLPAQIYYVSPRQVNLLVPGNFRATRVKIQLVRDGTAGPAIWLRLRDAAPGLFLLDAETVVATRPDFSVITRDNPVRPGDIVILWATGLGQTVPPLVYGEAPAAAAWIERLSEFRILLGDTEAPADHDHLIYAGVAPTFAGLYQINLKLPMELPPDPEVRLAVGDAVSPRGFRLPVKVE